MVRHGCSLATGDQYGRPARSSLKHVEKNTIMGKKKKGPIYRLHDRTYRDHACRPPPHRPCIDPANPPVLPSSAPSTLPAGHTPILPNFFAPADPKMCLHFYLNLYYLSTPIKLQCDRTLVRTSRSFCVFLPRELANQPAVQHFAK
jgi:hypothetical protein